jgi:para-aminobenzoate synthetase
MRTLLIDNYDSYTFNLFRLLGEVNGEEPRVVHSDALSWAELEEWEVDNVVISPGPGRPEHPRDVGVSLDALERAQAPVLGVCLGHQALALLAGGGVEHAPEPTHGRLSPIAHDVAVIDAVGGTVIGAAAAEAALR